MRVENQAFRRLLSVSPLAEAYAKEGYINMGEQLDEKLADFLHAQVIAYSKLESIKERIFAARDIGDKLEIAVEVMPSLTFVVPYRFKAQGRPALALRQLNIAALDAAMNRYRESQTFQQAFLKSIRFDLTQEELDQKMHPETGDETFLPRQVMLDLIQVAQGFLRMPKSGKRNELIEQYYLHQASSQLFFQFYFELLVKAPNQMVVGLVDKVFAYVLAALRRVEILHFMQSDISADQIEFWIEKDAPNARHPTLRKHIFSYVNNYSPILRAGGQQALSATGQRLLQNQMEGIKSMSAERLTLLLKSLRRYRGKGPARFILAQLQRQHADLLESLAEHLAASEDPEEQEINKLLESLSKSLRGKAAQKATSSGPAKVLSSLEAQRREKAARNLANMDTSKMMNQHQVADYLKEHMKKVYERARKEGAMTKDNIPKYLANFADSSSKVMAKPTKLETEEVEEFVASADAILEEIVDSAGLSDEELGDTREVIGKQTEALKNAESVEERGDILSNIGEKLMDAQNQAEDKLPDDQKAKVQFGKLRNAQIITIGIEGQTPEVTVDEFMSFPLASSDQTEQEWFKCHLSYLQILLGHSKIEPERVELIQQNLDQFPKIRYKKNFDIFPGGKFDDSVLSAVYSLWENNGLERLKLDQSA